MIAVKLAQRFRGGTLHFEHVLAEREARRHFCKRTLVRGESGRIESAERGEKLFV